MSTQDSDVSDSNNSEASAASSDSNSESSLAITVEALKGAAETSEDVIESLRDQLQRAKNTIMKLQGRITYVQNRKFAPWSQLDNAVLAVVFEFVIPPAPFLNPSLVLGPNSNWCEALRMKKVLTMVCKGWRQPALWLLYRHVTLRRVGQVFLFTRTLQSPQIVPLVRSISLSFHVPVPDHIRSLVSRSLTTTLKKCTQVKTLRFSHDFIHHYFTQTVFHISTEDDAFLAVLREVGPRIQGLHSEKVYGFPAVTYPLRFLSCFPNVRSLSISLHKETWSTADPALRFPHLEELSVTFHTIEDLASHIGMLQRWELPSLRQVTIDPTTCTTPPNRYMESLVSFFRTHGQNLADLIIGKDIATCVDKKAIPETLAVHKEAMVSIERIVALCPSLRYLALPGPMETSFVELIRDRTPHVHLDIWGPPRGDVINVLRTMDDYRTYNGIRLVDWDLFAHDMEDVPRFLFRPPSVEETSSGPITHNIYNKHIVQTCYGLYLVGQSSFLDNLRERFEVLMAEAGEGEEDDEDSEMRRHINWSEAPQEFDFEERLEYAYVVDSDPDSDSEPSGAEDNNGGRFNTSEYQPREEEEEEEEEEEFIEECVREVALELALFKDAEVVDEVLTEADMVEMYSATLEVGCVEYVPWP
ncbi:hypothetical protein BXZ70DRAFT_618372 [Cristinia sonorae]|uniref:F-box domain-containing protein n=1 Tax=Cristinia sonorae TaxID=1940300 RepID=A0A8K0UVN1_9AGAR|nr:hypothetical protein BXZ70DRAFT_618372 [Cristinia sonorae]